MGKLAGAAVAAGASPSRVDRLGRFAEGLEQLAGRWRREARDPRVAAALAERFGPSAPELLSTQDAVARLLASSFGAPGALPPKLLLRLHDALADLAMLAAHAPAAAEPAVVHIIDVRSRAQAARLETSTRKLLKELGRMLAAGAIGAAALGAMPAAAGDHVQHADGANGGGGTTLPAHGTNGGGGGAGDGAAINSSISGNFDKAGGPAVNVTVNGGDGGDGGDGFLVPPFVPVGFGGNGGSGGDGGSVNLTLDGAASTTGDNAVGVQVTSKAGAGGEGGDGYGAYGEGGSGAHGGAGGSVDLTSNASVTTQGKESSALFVQSAGGAGGDGGYGAGLVGSGGAGSGSGPGGHAGVINNGVLETFGTGSNGVLAQSIGGLSGSGGSAGGIGAFAGGSNAAGTGGSVGVTNNGVITTHGAVAYGVLAQSVGGGGGAAGGAGGVAALGGGGSGGGDGGAVTVVNGGEIETFGVASIGLFAQSVGGSGGVGGGAGGLVGIGGKGGASGDGKAVVVDNAGSVVTHNNLAAGVFAQSVGGGGGNGAGGGGLVGIGGEGGASGKGGTVTVTNQGSVETSGKLAQAVFAQSIGGGGGAGAGAGGLVAIGGKGGAGGDGLDVGVVNTGDLTTHGYDSYAVFAQSVGGGGGAGGGAGAQFAVGGSGAGGGAGGNVTVTNRGAIVTEKDGSGGVFAQSVGGGGGSGGDSVSLGLFVNLSIGGSGGTASKGGDVTAVNSGSIVTGGDRASAIYAQSVGGGGGGGGFGAGGAIGVYGAVSIGVGGAGGDGGKGGVVHVTADGTLTTHGADSRGVFAQSVGGGGGDGGYTVAAALAVGDVGAVAGSISVGGTAGKGGEGGEVRVDHVSGVTIDTTGDRATGVFAQSVGGGGGNGGWSGAISAAASGGASAAIGVAVGGEAGDGGFGGAVRIDTAGGVHTRGVDAAGLYAQSIGGGGGTGGFALAGALAGGTAAGAASVGVGGTGGGGGDAGDVTVLSVTDIVTEGDRSVGIYAQAVGGGGGAGGWSGAVAGAGGQAGGAVGVSVGGSGDHGGEGGIVRIDSLGSIDTTGEDAIGVFGQSVGGGGGSGGFSIAAAVAGGQGALGGSVGVGGGGDGGGNGDIVVIDTVGSIHTRGDRATGVFAQSIGGGGGNGGWSGSLAIAAGQTAGAVGVSVGGSAAGGGDGEAVTVDSRGAIRTEGHDAAGVLAQSVGGGGGTGGFSLAAGVGAGQTAGAASVSVGGAGGAGGDAELVKVKSDGQVVTKGDRSYGVQAQSIGGGGGSGGWSGSLAVGAGQTGAAITVGVGGFGGTGGDGGEVEVDVIDLILTLGDDATAVLAQSIGGGGGSGGFSLAAGVGAGQTSGSGSLTVGGFGGAAGDGKKVTVTSDADISTTGDRANGIQAQSIGGGGGAGGWTGSLAVAGGQTSGAVTVGIGGFGAGGGDGLDVTVDSLGQIETNGDDAVGVLAQSVGGGGGSGGFSIAVGGAAGQSTGAGSLSIGGGGGVGGDAGVVDVHSRQLIETHGDRAYAVQAQSIGGGGGGGGFSGAVTAALSSGKPVGVAASIGGFGGAGGDAKSVTVTSDLGAVTHGEAAHGLIAQSIGGGGGSGGFSISGALTAGTSTIGVSAAIGGAGGAAGDAGDVHVTTDGVTTTEGARAYGVFAQSVGGGGGDGGFAGALTGGLNSTDNIAIGVSIGGFGGSAGQAGDVFVTNNGKVGTRGDGATAVFAQSVGGGGGSGGMAVSAALGGAKSKNVSIALGGSAAGGGEGGDVNVTSTDLVVTEGDDAIGIFAQSVGGGGGAGGAAGALAVSGGESTNLSMNIGGFGGAGSTGGDVTVDNSGTVVTHGEQSHGVFAESVGGGGGHGGMAGIDENQWSDYMAGGAGTVSLGSNSNNISVALGGFGGTGDDGGVVKVTNSGVVATTGESQANAIYAQSIGGGGGDAGVATAASGSFGQGKNGTYAIALGGFGGQAGDGDLVQVINSGALSTVGGNSTGIVAQSVGGGGGSGGDARGFSLSFSKKASGAGAAKATSVNVSIGGQGGAAGEGGEVRVTNSGQILTEGGDSHGVFAQSVGGGGGRGGLISTQGEEVVTFLDLANKGEAKGGQIAIGGSGAGGGGGGLVTVGNSGLIWTKGKDAHGVFAQSVGGGGGDGGSGLAGEVSIGGQGGVAGDGGEVRVTNSATIVTEGALSRGVFAQSVGGGGGTGGATDYDGDDTYSYSDALSKTMGEIGKLTDAKDLIDSFSQPAWGVSIGGTGGSAGDGGAVTVDNSGVIQTSGRLSHGIMAQSVGGGGGTGGEGTITAVGQIVFSGVGGTAGDGGDVTVVNSGRIQTEGYGAYGVFAQSVGGGGGVAGDVSLGIASWGDFSAYGGEDYSDYADMSINPLDGYGGDGGDVKVTNTGDIVLLGEGSVGIFAQSVGGGGGLFGSGLGLSFAGSLGGTGDAGAVTVIQNGNIWTGGKNGVGAFFQSQAGDIDPGSAPASGASAPALSGFSPKDIVATLNGDVRGGSVYGKGVMIDGGKNNVVTLNGVVSAGSNLAIQGTTGNDTIISNKGVIGNIDLGTGANAFHNTAASTLVTLDHVKLNGGLLTNDGVVTPGGAGLVQVTRVEGGFRQTATGVFLADLDLGKTGKAGEIDRLDVTGSLDLKGKFVLQVADPGHILPGDHTATILNGSGVVGAAGLQLVAPTSSIATFELKTTADDLNLRYVVDFSPAGFNANRTAVGDHINAIQLAGSTDAFAPVTAELFWEPSRTNLANYYDSFSAETYADQVAVTNFAIAGFTDSMMTCPTAPGRDEADSCVWTKAGGRQLTLDATAQDMAFKERSTGLSGGFESAVNPHWRIGAAASAEDLRTGIPTRTQGDGERYQVGAVVKAVDGPATAALAFDAGASSVETRRAVLLPSGLRMAEGKQRQTFQAVTARAAYRLGDDRGYAKPIAELSYARISTDGFAETGAGALNLIAPKQVDQSTRASLKLEVGGEFMQGVTAIRPYARIGASHMLSGRAPVFTTAFQGAAPVAGGYGVAARLDKTTVDAELGVGLANARGASARLNWSGQFGDRVSNQSLAVKFTVPF